MTGFRSAATAARSMLSGIRTTSLALGWAILVAAALASCRRVPDLTVYRDQARELVRQRGAELVQLDKRLDGLRRRAAALSDGVPGAAQGRELVARCERSAGELRAAVAGLVGKVGSAIKTAEPARVERTLSTAAAQIERGVLGLRAELDAAASELARAEAAAPAAQGRMAR